MYIKETKACWTIKDIGICIEEANSFGELNFLYRNIQNSSISIENKNLLLTMIPFKMVSLGFTKKSDKINYKQSEQIYKYIRKRINRLLDGSHSMKYNKSSKDYLDKLLADLCDKFEIFEYKDLKLSKYNDAVVYIDNWKY